MNTYSRALRHITISDVKQKHQQKLIEKKILEEKKKNENEYISSVMEEKKYDWRKELSEQMTTSDVFSYSLPAVGDVDLNYPNLVSSGGNNSSIDNNVVTIGGAVTPPISNGILLKFNSNSYDTLKFNVNNSSGNYIGFFIGNASSPNLLVTSSGTYTLSVPQSGSLSLLIDTPDSPTVTISNFSFQRRTPLNVFASLDSPEATSFVRTGSGDLSPEEKRKRLKEMFKASDEYVMKMLGKDFPGTGAVPPGEFDPFAQTPPGEAGDTPGVETIDYGTDLTPLSKNPYGTEIGQISQTGLAPGAGIKFMQDLIKDGMGGNQVRTTVNGVGMVGTPSQVIKQIKLNFPGGV